MLRCGVVTGVGNSTGKAGGWDGNLAGHAAVAWAIAAIRWAAANWAAFTPDVRGLALLSALALAVGSHTMGGRFISFAAPADRKTAVVCRINLARDCIAGCFPGLYVELQESTV